MISKILAFIHKHTQSLKKMHQPFALLTAFRPCLAFSPRAQAAGAPLHSLEAPSCCRPCYCYLPWGHQLLSCPQGRLTCIHHLPMWVSSVLVLPCRQLQILSSTHRHTGSLKMHQPFALLIIFRPCFAFSPRAQAASAPLHLLKAPSCCRPCCCYLPWGHQLLSCPQGSLTCIHHLPLWVSSVLVLPCRQLQILSSAHRHTGSLKMHQAAAFLVVLSPRAQAASAPLHSLEAPSCCRPCCSYLSWGHQLTSCPRDSPTCIHHLPLWVSSVLVLPCRRLLSRPQHTGTPAASKCTRQLPC
jgi:hypothetical protein